MKELFVMLIVPMALVITGCVGGGPSSSPGFPPVPPEPTWIGFTRAPVIEKIIEDKGDNAPVDFRVSDEFMENAVLQKKYIKRISDWKTEHALP